MSDEPEIPTRELTEGEAVGIANAVQAQLIGVHNTFGGQFVMNGIAQYILNGAEADPRKGWNEFVGQLRDVYFTISGLKDSG